MFGSLRPETSPSGSQPAGEVPAARPSETGGPSHPLILTPFLSPNSRLLQLRRVARGAVNGGSLVWHMRPPNYLQ